MKTTLLALLMLLSTVALANKKSQGDYPETGTVVDSPQHAVYVIETATTRYTVFGHPQLQLHEVVHFRLEKRLKGFIVSDKGKEDHYYLNGQQDVSIPYTPPPADTTPSAH